MNTEKLFQGLEQIQPLSPAFRHALEKELIEQSFPQNHFLLQPPQVASHAYFLTSGFAYSYTLLENTKKIEWFWKENQFIISPKSFFEQTPSREFIKLAASSKVLCISFSSVQALLHDFPESNAISRFIMNKYFENSRQRLRDLQHLSAAERFRRLVIYYPSIEQFVSQETIASYLGIAPQSLSRIKKRSLGRN